MNVDRKEHCQDCKQMFYTDSPHHDVYCGDCRRLWNEQQHEFREWEKQLTNDF